MKPRLLFYCQHVLGMGHLMRSREIVRGLNEFDVWFLNGGEPVEGVIFPPEVRMVQLPPIRSDAEFKDISASEEVKSQRRQMLVSAAGEIRPDAVIVEMFPFGRRKFAFELVPFLDKIRERGGECLVVSSVRDILVSKRDQARHEEQACRLLNQYFDMVMVHSDERFQRLEETFQRTADIRCPIHYTGFVTEAPARPARIIASAGGGRVGFDLLHAAIQASLRVQVRHELEVFTGPYLPVEEFEALRRAAAGAAWIRIEHFAGDFVERLQSASLLVSMAGYNTCMNILSTGVPAIVHPFTGNGNEEQTIRARKLAGLGTLQVLESLSVPQLAAAMEAAVKPKLNLDGAANAALLLRGCLAHV